MEEGAEVLMEQPESAPENIQVTETKKKAPRGRGRGRGGRGYVRGKMRGRALNGFGPIRRGVGRMRPYPDARGRRGMREGLLFPPSVPRREMMGVPFLPPPPRYGLPPPPLPPPPPGPMSFRGRPPPLRARGMPTWPRGHFPPPRRIQILPKQLTRNTKPQQTVSA
ncbi:uncharacterized protein LOC133383849 isoform X2 [Rhineura floridana]|uniref:uncharacterized protein LOC133383849 isoform X2 n=2 Tax=Rhineura floridana TaxID=261503 RepID=UPI002AC88375|nr:uncharacterized protein LOC133383849 isoform X2 [Rhineura floridana]